MPYYRSRPTIRKLDKRIRKIENEVELKHKDETFFVGQPDANFSVYDICTVGNGTDNRARIGNEIMTTSLKMKLGITWTPNTYNDTTAFIRMILFWDSEPNGEIPSIVAGSLGDQSVLDPNSTTLASIFDQYDYNTTSSRFRVIYDKVWTLRSQFAVQDPITSDVFPAPTSLYITKKWKLGRKQIYNGDDPDPEQLVTNGIYAGWYLYSYYPSPSEFNSLALDATFRLYFKDC